MDRHLIEIKHFRNEFCHLVKRIQDPVSTQRDASVRFGSERMFGLFIFQRCGWYRARCDTLRLATDQSLCGLLIGGQNRFLPAASSLSSSGACLLPVMNRKRQEMLEDLHCFLCLRCFCWDALCRISMMSRRCGQAAPPTR